MSWDTIATREIIAKAAEYKKVKISPGAWVSKVLMSCRLDQEILNFLMEKGFGNESNPERITVTHSETKEYWIFDAEKKDVFLFFSFIVNVEKRTVIFIPRIRGPIQCPTNRKTEFDLFLSLARYQHEQHETETPAIVLKMISSGNPPVVGWEEIGLGDIAPIGDLFAKFADREKGIAELSRSSASPFIPNPNHNFEGPQEKVFVFGSTQRKVLESWERQLEEYKAQLALLI